MTVRPRFFLQKTGRYEKNMEVAGITPGGSYSPDGKTFRYGVLIPASEIRAYLDEWYR